MRLRELEDEGFIECVGGKRQPTMVVWRLTEKGRDTMPILMQLTTFPKIHHCLHALPNKDHSLRRNHILDCFYEMALR
jgi:DNA-binding HxlR family transcriptional regulator